MDDVTAMVDSYRQSLSHEIRDLFDRYRIVDVARRVVGVGSVGTRCWICLFEGPGHPGGDRLILQVKEAQASVLEPYVGASTLGHHGLRVVAGQRLTQATSDIFLGWAEAARSGRQYYVRQLWDAKGSRDPMAMDVGELRYYGALCGMALAARTRAHRRPRPDRRVPRPVGRVRPCDRGVGCRVHRHDRRRSRGARARDRDRAPGDTRMSADAERPRDRTAKRRCARGVLHEYGRPEDVLVLDDVPIPAPEPGELRVRVQAIPLNLNDLERITGGNMMVRPELPYSPGMEVMGIVDATGDGVGEWSGKRVVAMPKGAHGGFAEYAICPVVSAFEMPAAIPLPDAAALYFPFHLAWLGLFDRAQLQPGESVLIHAAAGGSGSAAVQLAKHAGARVFATAGTDEKVARCRELGADVAINYNDTDFAAVVLDATGNRGVDVVFDNVGEAVMEASMKSLAYNGRYLMMGFASNKEVADEPFIVPRRIALGNFKLCGVLLAYAAPDMAEMVKTAMGWNFASDELGARVMQEIVDLVLAGSVHAVVGDVVAFEALPTAMAAMANRESVGPHDRPGRANGLTLAPMRQAGIGAAAAALYNSPMSSGSRNPLRVLTNRDAVHFVTKSWCVG